MNELPLNTPYFSELDEEVHDKIMQLGIFLSNISMEVKWYNT